MVARVPRESQALVEEESCPQGVPPPESAMTEGHQRLGDPLSVQLIALQVSQTARPFQGPGARHRRRRGGGER